MVATNFDTHAAIKVMKNSGLEEAHAESIVSAIQMRERHGEDLVTKAHMNTALEDLEERVIARMTIRLGLMLFAAAGLAVAAAKFF